MKIALCYSGQIGAFHKAIKQQKASYIRDDMDIYVYTSDVISQKSNIKSNLPPISKVHEYLPEGMGWRKNIGRYGIIYKVDKELVKKVLSPIESQIVSLQIEEENLEDSIKDWDMSKWEWLRKRQLKKLYNCSKMVNKEYDIIVRSRMEFGPNVTIDIEKICNSYSDIKNKIFLFGGWKCSPPMIFMDEFICDGFAFGTPEVMNKFSSLYLKEQPYPYNPKYKECWEKYGDNVEHQFKSHLEANGIEVVYIGSQRNMYHLWR